jgi:hypothetical protein
MTTQRTATTKYDDRTDTFLAFDAITGRLVEGVAPSTTLAGVKANMAAAGVTFCWAEPDEG